MKIRNGFVSNSSSSSFMIVYDDSKKEIDTTCSHCKRGFKANSLQEALEIAFGKDNDYCFDEYNKEYIEDSWYEEDKKEKMLKELKSHKKVARISFNMHDNRLKVEYEALLSQKCFEEIYRDSD